MDPAGCLRILREWNDVVCVAGNAELALLTPDWDEFPFKNEEMYRSIIKLLGWWQARISADSLDWITSWPTLLALDGACILTCRL